MMKALVIFFLCASISADAAVRYIRAGASGANNGTSWADAYTTFAAARSGGALARGNTNFVAGGTYSEDVTIDPVASGSTWTHIRKANATENSSDAGWNSSYATTQARVVGFVSLENGYISWDGVTGSGTNGHGIIVSNDAVAVVFWLEAGTSFYQVYGTEIRGTNMTTQTSFDGIYWNNASNQKGVDIQRCWIHEVSRNGFLCNYCAGTSFTDYGVNFVSNVVMRTGDVQNGDHGQGMQIGHQSDSAYFNIRANQFYDILGSAHIAFLGGVGAIHRWHRITDNVFFNTDNATFNVVSPGVIWAHDAADVATNIFIANNLFYNFGSVANPGSQAQVVLDTVGATNNSLINNLWETSNQTARNNGFATNRNNGFYAVTGNGATSTTGSTNGQVIGSSSALTSPSTGNYMLVSGSYAVDAGFDVTDTVTVDFNGETWTVPMDLGAFQFDGAPPPTPNVPRVHNGIRGIRGF